MIRRSFLGVDRVRESLDVPVSMGGGLEQRFLSCKFI